MTRIVAASLALLLSAACSGSPAAPSDPPGAPAAPSLPSIDGTWSGEWQWTGCSGLRHCFSLTQQTAPFVFHFRQLGEQIEGIVVTESLVAEVRGARGTDGRWLLSGFTPEASAKDNRGSVHVRQFVLETRGDSLAGEINFFVKQGAESQARFLFPVDYSASIVTARRQPEADGTLQGRWTGEFLARGCATTERFCWPLEQGELGMFALTTSGGTAELVVGSDRFTVTPAGSGGDVQIPAVTTEQQGGTEATVSGFTARLDKFGRLEGSFTLTQRYTSPSGAVRITTYDAVLWQVVRGRPGGP